MFYTPLMGDGEDGDKRQSGFLLLGISSRDWTAWFCSLIPTEYPDGFSLLVFTWLLILCDLVLTKSTTGTVSI